MTWVGVWWKVRLPLGHLRNLDWIWRDVWGDICLALRKGRVIWDLRWFAGPEFFLLCMLLLEHLLVLVYECALYVEGKVKWRMIFELCNICQSYVRTVLMLSFFLASESSSTTLSNLATTLVVTGSISTSTSASYYPLVGLEYSYLSFRPSDILGKFPVDFVSEVGKGLIIRQGHLWPSHVKL